MLSCALRCRRNARLRPLRACLTPSLTHPSAFDSPPRSLQAPASSSEARPQKRARRGAAAAADPGPPTTLTAMAAATLSDEGCTSATCIPTGCEPTPACPPLSPVSPFDILPTPTPAPGPDPWAACPFWGATSQHLPLAPSPGDAPGAAAFDFLASPCLPSALLELPSPEELALLDLPSGDDLSPISPLPEPAAAAGPCPFSLPLAEPAAAPAEDPLPLLGLLPLGLDAPPAPGWELWDEPERPASPDLFPTDPFGPLF